MKTETISRSMLTASKGMILTDGKSFGRVVYLADGCDGSNWYEISEKEYNAMMEESDGVDQ